jgi:adenylate cyclase
VKGKARPVDIFTLQVDERTQALNEEAIAAYRAKDWARSEAAWRKLIDIDPADPVAPIYLARIEQFRKEPPPEGWEGTVALEKM